MKSMASNPGLMYYYIHAVTPTHHAMTPSLGREKRKSGTGLDYFVFLCVLLQVILIGFISSLSYIKKLLLLIDTLATLYITSCFPMILSHNWPNNNTANITISKAKN